MLISENVVCVAPDLASDLSPNGTTGDTRISTRHLLLICGYFFFSFVRCSDSLFSRRKTVLSLEPGTPLFGKVELVNAQIGNRGGVMEPGT